MKLLITLVIFLLSVRPTEAKSPYRVSFDRFAHYPVVLPRYGLQLSKPQLLRNPKQLNLASIALNNCPGTTGKCLKAVRMAVQKSKGMPLVGECLSAKNYGPILENRYGAERLSISNPLKAPMGSIIVCAPKRGIGHGHIEIVTPKGYCSDHLSAIPYKGNVLGIYTL